MRRAFKRSRMKTRSHRSPSESSLMHCCAAACTRAEAIENIPAGTEVTVLTQDGTLVRGKIAKVEPEVVTLTGERPNTHDRGRAHGHRGSEARRSER